MTTSFKIGIDLGTTYARIGIYDNNHFEIIDDDSGNRQTPIYISFNDTETLVGNPALYQIEMNPQNTIFNIKRIIGRNFNEENVQSDINYWPFKVIEDNNRPYVQVKYKNNIENYTAEEISCLILSEIKEIAEERLGKTVTDAVITVPACFNDIQRKATIDAGRIAGLNVLDIINEPTAAAIAYGFNNKIDYMENVLVIDFGGGFFEVSLLSINKGNYKIKATSGDIYLGGENFNNRLIDYFIEEIKTKDGKDIKTDPNYPKMLTRLRLVCEDAKCKLSSIEKTNVEIINLYDQINFKSSITRTFFEQLCKDLFDRLIKPIENVIQDSKISKSDVNEIVLVGGSTRIPKVQEIISTYFDGKELKKRINPDEAVVNGAAIHAFILSKKKEKMENSNKCNDMNNRINKEENPSNINKGQISEKINKYKKDREKENSRIESLNNLERFIYEICDNLEKNAFDKYFIVYKKSIEKIIQHKKKIENKNNISNEKHNIILNLSNKMSLIYQMNSKLEKSIVYNNNNTNNESKIIKCINSCVDWIKNNQKSSNDDDNTTSELTNKMNLNNQIWNDFEKYDIFNENYMNYIDEIYINYKKELIKCFNSYKDWIKDNPDLSKEEYDNIKTELNNKLEAINQIVEEAKKINAYYEKEKERKETRENLINYIHKFNDYLKENEKANYVHYINYINKLIDDLTSFVNKFITKENINKNEFDHEKRKQELDVTMNPFYQMIKNGKDNNNKNNILNIFNNFNKNYDIIKNENNKKNKYFIESSDILFEILGNKNNIDYIYYNYKNNLITDIIKFKKWVESNQYANKEEYEKIMSIMEDNWKLIDQIIQESKNYDEIIKSEYKNTFIKLNYDIKKKINELCNNNNKWIIDNENNPNISITDYDNKIKELRALLYNLSLTEY